MSLILNRRKLIGGLGLLIAAPAVVRASSLMPVKMEKEIQFGPGQMVSFKPGQAMNVRFISLHFGGQRIGVDWPAEKSIEGIEVWQSGDDMKMFINGKPAEFRVL